MISRRNVRIKVMQLLYAMETSTENTFGKKEPVAALRDLIDESEHLYFFIIYCITQVALYAETDARHRAGKNITTAADLNVNTRIAGNEIVWSLIENSSFKAADAALPISLLEQTKPIIRNTYKALVETPEYRKYIAEEERAKKAETRILEFIFTNLMMADEKFISLLESEFTHVDDDIEMVSQLVFSTLHKPGSFDLNGFVPAETWNYGRSLLRTVSEKNEYLAEIIKPKLKNWDIERIAQIDVVLIKLGVAEFLYFETIPTKVTINEYIDIAKDYSTEQSGQFINGILDEIRKALEKENKIEKVSFKK